MSILLADVVSVGSRVVRYHDGLLIVAVLMYFVVCGKADMLVLVDLFYCPAECGAQTVGGIAATLGKTNACCATFGVGSIDSHTFLVAVIGFGQAGPFVLCEGLRNRSSLSRSRRSVCLMCCCRAILHCLRCSRGSGGMMVLLSSICSAGPLM
jgi:hypothetical protein